MLTNQKNGWVFLAWSIICFIGFLQYLLAYYFIEDEATIYQVFAYPLIRFVSGAIVIILIILPGYKYLVRQKRVLKIVGFIFLAFFFCIAYLAIFIILFDLISRDNINAEFLPRLVENALRSFSYIATYFIMAISIMFTFDHLESKVQAIEKQKEVENLLSEARVKILKNQLQPHFLFNALNSVVSIIPTKKEQAQDMLVDISDLLRASLYNDLGVPITLKEEIDTLNLFISIEKKRYDDQLEVNFNIPEEVYDAQILPFSLQPLVENAIKHGFKRNTAVLKIIIEAHKSNDLLEVIVKNNGSKLSEYQAGIGLNNITERLDNFYGNKFKFDLYQSGEWVCNKIEIIDND